MKILLIDDHSVVRQGLKSMLKEAFPEAHFGEAGTATEAMQLVRSDSWHIVVLDIGLPGRDGVEVLKDIKHERAELPVIMLSMYPEDQFAVRVLKAGAAGYMTKETAAHELVDAVRRVLSGERYISAKLAQHLAASLSGAAGAGGNAGAPLHDRLSDREYQVMCLLASGKSVSQIADGLSLSVKTISTYRTHILQKMSMTSNAEIIRYALMNALVN